MCAVAALHARLDECTKLQLSPVSALLEGAGARDLAFKTENSQSNHIFLVTHKSKIY